MSMPTKSLYRNVRNLIANRHWHIIKRHITPRKLYNAALAVYAYRRGRARTASYPLYLKVETTDCCNLRCKYCHDGSVPRKNTFMDLHQYQVAVNAMSPYLLEISLYDQGEPLLDPSILEYIRYAHDRNVGTIISTNLSMSLSDELIEQLVKSGLDYVIVGIDGVTQETYEKYRVKGDLERVLSNLRRLVEMKRMLNSRTPTIEWQMIDFDFNRPEQRSAENLSRGIGVDRFCLKADCYSSYTPDAAIGHVPSEAGVAADYARQKNCLLLWTSLAIECDGAVSACLSRDDESLYMGNLNEKTLMEIWKSDEYAALRRMHAQAGCQAQYLCQTCSLFDGRPQTRQPSE